MITIKTAAGWNVRGKYLGQSFECAHSERSAARDMAVRRMSEIAQRLGYALPRGRSL